MESRNYQICPAVQLPSWPRELKCNAQKDKCEWFDRSKQEAENVAAQNDIRQVA